MKVKIEITERSTDDSLKAVVIEGTITTTLSTRPISHAELGAMLFQMEYTLNEYAPKMRVHIGLETETK